VNTSDGEDAWLAAALRAFEPSADTVLGIGHDVAAVRVGTEGVAVLAKDVIVEGVHFHLAECGPEAAARKALAINLSDLAAAAAVPVGFLVGAVLPRPASRALFDGLMRGFADAAHAFACPCLGGDTNAAEGPLVLSVTVLGRPGVMGVVSRAGARVGDLLSVTGPLGGSLAGRHLVFEPRTAEAAALADAGVPHAMMDLSDGLSRDLPRLCRASHVGAALVGERVPIHPDATGEGSRTPLEQALHDGEDFELLVAHAPLDEAARRILAGAQVRLTEVGRVVAAEEGVTIVVDGQRAPLAPRGYDHLTSS